MKGKSRIFIIDGDNLLRRLFHAAERSGPFVPLHLFSRKVLEQVYARRGGMLVVVWDGGHAKWRKELVPEYKVRPPEKAEKDASVKLLKQRAQQLLDAYQIAQVELEGVEADDVISYLARACDMSRVYSNDKDFLTLVTRNRTVVRPSGKNTEVVNVGDVERITGVATAHHYRVYKAIVGDKSDNVAGVPGMGDGSACALLEGFPADLVEPEAFRREGEAALIERSANSKSKRIQLLSQHVEAFRTALAVTDLLACDLLSMSAVDELLTVLMCGGTTKENRTSGPQEPNFEEVAKLYERFQFKDFLPSSDLLTRRVRRLEGASISFGWCRAPHPRRWMQSAANPEHW